MTLSTKNLLLSTVLLLSFILPSFSQSANVNDEFKKMNNLLYLLDKNYVDKVNMHNLVEKVIVKTLQELDPHSVYIPKEELKKMNEPLVGNFEGVGIQFNILADTIMVVNTIAGGPSEKLGIMAGDKIVEIEDEIVAGIGMQNSGVIKRLKGEKGTVVNVSIKRQGVKEILDFSITRDKIPLYSVDAGYMVTPEIGYIKVNRFSAITIKELRQKLAVMKSSGMKSLVLDLQGNGGGYLSTAIEMADEFLTKEKLIVYTEGKSYPKEEHNSTEIGLWEKGNLVVLVDESSASASEIVSGAMQDWDRGLLVGRRTFGKGLVQKPFMLVDGSAVRLTISKYFTPSGRCIQKPYDTGAADYYKEKYERLSNGELFSADSIDLPDSLMFLTNKKRKVYGGGGILPDVFVGIDTTQNSEYFSKIVRKGLLNTYALTYANKNRDELLAKYTDVYAFKKGFEMTDEFLVEMTNYFANEGGINFEEKDFATSKEFISLRFKALLARSVWDPEAFYIIINDLNESLKKAIEVLEDGSYRKMKLAKN